MRPPLLIAPNRLGYIFALMLSLALFGIACGASPSPSDTVRYSRATLGGKVKVLRWRVWSVREPRTIRVAGEVGHCVGYPEPKIKRPYIKYRSQNVYIKLKVETPRYKRGVVCGGVELFVKRTIKLKRDLSNIKLYDSGVDPPKLRWPR